ncbi:MAG: hypothetical protein ACN6PJ_16005 [Achromobacter sp.]|uniref:hypothetical protein n=1 Tax=Achromobacter sp. TaxID=134375 RepID=UPI003CFE200C
MEPWPFDTITPEEIDALTDEEKQGLDAAVAAYIGECLRRRGVDPAPPTSTPA